MKIAEDLGEENLTAEQKYIVDQIKASKQQGEIVKGVGAGLWEFTKDTATGVWNVLMTPPEQVLYDMGLAVINYDETYAQISAAIASSYERDMVNGNDYTRARWVTYAIATVGASLVGTKGVDKIGKAGFATGKNTVKNVGEAAANKLNAVKNSSSFGPRYGFDGGFEGVPYNVVDSLGLRDHLMTKAADTYKFFKGTGNVNRLIPGTPGVVTGGNSNKLGKNMMEDMGLKRSTKWSGYQAQHVIPSEMANNPVIQKIGMNFDDSSNGIFLRVPDNDISTMSRHRGYHSVYNEVVERALNKMDINQSVDSLQKQVYELQSNLRRLQENGLPLYPSQGATIELWERKLKQLEK